MSFLDGLASVVAAPMAGGITTRRWWRGKVDLLAQDPVAVVSFTSGRASATARRWTAPPAT